MNKTVARWPKWHARYKKSLATVQVLFVELGNNGAAPKRVAVVGIDLQVFKLPEAKNASFGPRCWVVERSFGRMAVSTALLVTMSDFLNRLWAYQIFI